MDSIIKIDINIISSIKQQIKKQQQMSMDVPGFVEIVQNFIHSEQFWHWHGFVLSGLWVVLSALAIFIKSISVQIHMFLFMIIDFTTIFFAGSAIYLTTQKLGDFLQWGFVKQAHVIAGTIFSILVIYQHIGGAKAFMTKKPNPKHRKFGKYLVSLGRIVAAIGWILGQNSTNAIIVFIASLPILLFQTLSAPEQKKKPQPPLQQPQKPNKKGTKRQ